MCIGTLRQISSGIENYEIKWLLLQSSSFIKSIDFVINQNNFDINSENLIDREKLLTAFESLQLFIEILDFGGPHLRILRTRYE